MVSVPVEMFGKCDVGQLVFHCQVSILTSVDHVSCLNERSIRCYPVILLINDLGHT